MTQEEKAKAYDEALERAKEMITAMTDKGGVAKIDDIQYLFPELKESEDERIRKGLIEIFNSALGQDFLQRKAGLDRDKVITYLEKQKEHHYTKRNDLFDKCVENCDSATMKEVSDNVDAILQKEQKPAECEKDLQGWI